MGRNLQMAGQGCSVAIATVKVKSFGECRFVMRRRHCLGLGFRVVAGVSWRGLFCCLCGFIYRVIGSGLDFGLGFGLREGIMAVIVRLRFPL